MIALITGANRGLGKEIANFLDSVGWSLILVTREPIKDLSSTYKDAFNVYGELDEFDPHTFNFNVLINNAGFRDAIPFEDMGMSIIEHHFHINALTPIRLVKQSWDILKQNKGFVFNINSIAADSPSEGETAYAASKAALAGFSKAIQFDAVRASIKVIDIHLGAMQTDMTKHSPNHSKLIAPREVAVLIHQLTMNYETMRITEITLNRRNY